MFFRLCKILGHRPKPLAFIELSQASQNLVGRILLSLKVNRRINTKALVENGLVRRLEDGADRRVTRVRITQTGMKVLARSRRRKEELLATRLRGLSDRDLETLDRATHILDRLTGGEP